LTDYVSKITSKSEGMLTEGSLMHEWARVQWEEFFLANRP